MQDCQLRQLAHELSAVPELLVWSAEGCVLISFSVTKKLTQEGRIEHWLENISQISFQPLFCCAEHQLSLQM